MSQIVRNYALITASNLEEEHYQRILNSKEIVLLNRGISLAALTTILKVKIIRPEFGSILADIAIKLFIVGSKSNYYVGKHGRLNKNNVHAAVEDIGNETFSKLYEKLIEVFITKPREKKSVRRFVETNPDFVRSLRQSDFNCIENLSDGEKILIRDYYLALLHQVYDKRYHSKSALISTSTDPNIAERFHGEEEGILIKYFIPRDLVSTLTVPPYALEEGNAARVIQHLNLPLVTSPPFVEQSEYSVKRALFPHFIASFSLISGGHVQTILNPEMSNFSPDVLREGFNINQESFFEVVRDTAFERRGEYVNGRFREI